MKNKYFNQTVSNIRTILHALPKVELHRHLEGSVRLSTLVEIAHQTKLGIPNVGIENLRPLVQMVGHEPDFQEFLAKFTILREFYKSREAVLRIAYEVVADAAYDNIKYLELRFNPVAQAANQGFALEEVTDWVVTAVNKAQDDFDIQVRLIIQMGRHEPQFARKLAELALAHKHKGIVGLDLAGDEKRFSAGKFIDIMRWAKGQGLHITSHAGECSNCPASNILEAVEEIGATRIGHGISAIHDSKVVNLLRQKNITLEICPTSNLHTKVIENIHQHPLLNFHRAGVLVTINTDDPLISNITLTDEYLLAIQEMGVTFSELKAMIVNAAKATFLPPTERVKLVSWFIKTLQQYHM
ncbi:MAG: adenosine deaminase [Anaerolineaceae bacterium 4572_78]|nr:MAG: adenosine deaminase [Anaerolineaceae bacterium 4572_78]